MYICYWNSEILLENIELKFRIIMFQAQAFGSPGEEKLPINEGWGTSVYPQASLVILHHLVTIVTYSVIEC